MRRAAKLDDNQPDVVKALRRLPGVSVCSTAAIGRGFPDVAVGYAGRTWLYEIKDPNKPPSARRLTPNEEEWHAKWCGQVDTVLTWQEIAAGIGYPGFPLDPETQER